MWWEGTWKWCVVGKKDERELSEREGKLVVGGSSASCFGKKALARTTSP